MLLRQLLTPGIRAAAPAWLGAAQHTASATRSLTTTGPCFAGDGRAGVETDAATANKPPGDTYYATPTYPGGRDASGGGGQDEQQHPVDTGGAAAHPHGAADTSSMNAATGRAADPNAGRLSDPVVHHPGEAGDMTDNPLKTPEGIGKPAGHSNYASTAGPSSIEGHAVAGMGKAVAPGDVPQEENLQASEAAEKNIKDAPAEQSGG